MTWPDWAGEVVAIIASGPSAKKADLNKLRDRSRIITIKQTFELCPWADAVYGCDPAWWKHRKGLPEFQGLKIAWRGAGLSADYPDIRPVDLERSKADKYATDLQFAKLGTVGGGGNSGFQALNLALQFGSRQIILIGFDMSDAGGKHWYGRNNWPQANNPDGSCFRRWMAALDAAVPKLKAIGADVVNCSPTSALKTFPILTIEQALARFDATKADAMDRVRSA